VVALDSHDACGGYAEIGGREVTHADEIGGDEGVLQGDENVEGGLGVVEHVGRIEERGVRRGFAGDGLLKEIVRHLFLKSGLKVALIVGGDAREERRQVNDVGVRGDGEGLSDLGRNEDGSVSFFEIVVFVIEETEGIILLGGGGCGSETTEGGDTGSSSDGGGFEQGATREGCGVASDRDDFVFA
jgi:hypothetical protein